MRIRRATTFDIPDLMALEKQSTTAAHWSTQQYEASFSDESPTRLVLILEHEAGVHGFIIGRALDKEWEIENIAVAASARRRGFGTRLIAEFLSLARSAGAEKVFLEVRESNHQARRLYEKSAFLQSGHRRRYYRDPEEDAIVYQFDFT
jgi:ribosomal-protein-alanine acetyltransferase